MEDSDSLVLMTAGLCIDKPDSLTALTAAQSVARWWQSAKLLTYTYYAAIPEAQTCLTVDLKKRKKTSCTLQRAWFLMERIVKPVVLPKGGRHSQSWVFNRLVSTILVCASEKKKSRRKRSRLCPREFKQMILLNLDLIRKTELKFIYFVCIRHLSRVVAFILQHNYLALTGLLQN